MKHQIIMSEKEVREIIADHFGVDTNSIIMNIHDSVLLGAKVILGPYFINGEIIDADGEKEQETCDDCKWYNAETDGCKAFGNRKVERPYDQLCTEFEEKDNE